MTKLTMFTFSLLLLFVLSYAARPRPVLYGDSPAPADNLRQAVKEETEVDDRVCEELDKEECLMRRTLVAHLDYIYSQDHKP
ncbi:Phytosulfokine [Dillenia turbinata]|uniref:Phytosulfokine n=1 Tax=Dillenia turbinata TaxID=194707 RepID=A0AAN8W1K7_9MAGN